MLVRVDELSPNKPQPEGEFDNWSQEVKPGQVPVRDLLGSTCVRRKLSQTLEGRRPRLPSPKFNMNERLDIEMSSRGWHRLAPAA